MICRKCGKQISDNSKRCPACHHKNKKPLGWIIFIIAALSIIAISLGVLFGMKDGKSDDASRERNVTTEKESDIDTKESNDSEESNKTNIIEGNMKYYSEEAGHWLSIMGYDETSQALTILFDSEHVVKLFNCVYEEEFGENTSLYEGTNEDWTITLDLLYDKINDSYTVNFNAGDNQVRFDGVDYSGVYKGIGKKDQYDSSLDLDKYIPAVYLTESGNS